MTNYEKYVDKIREYKGSNFCEDFMIPHNIVTSKDKCDTKSCVACMGKLVAWLSKEYEETDVDWNKVAVDTPVLVRSCECEKWFKRHFAKYEDGKVCTWDSGFTSWTVSSHGDMNDWKYAKLAEDCEEYIYEEAEPEVDWSKVKVDTPILVREIPDLEWQKRRFAKYKNGKVYAWVGGRESWNETRMYPWKYAKIARTWSK